MIMTPLFMNCFFGHPPSESALYDFQNSRLGIYSTKYSRPFYLWILALFHLILRDALPYLTLALFLPLLFALGTLSSPFVTLFYALEQIQIHLFGASSRVNDLRILLSFICHCGSVVLISLISNTFGGWDSYADSSLFEFQLLFINSTSLVASFLFSLNFLTSHSLHSNHQNNTPHKNEGVNALIESQNFFAQYIPKTHLCKETIVTDIWTIIGGLAVIASISLYSQEILQTDSSSLQLALLLLSSILCILFWLMNVLLAASYQQFLLGCCKSVKRLQAHPPSRRAVIAVKRSQQVLLILLYSLLSLLHFDSPRQARFSSRLNLFSYCLFSLHFFHFLFRNLHSSFIIVFISALLYLLQASVRSFSFPLFLVIVHFCYHRAALFVKKFHSWFVAIIANCYQGMDKDPLGLFHLFLIPFSLAVICLTTLFDTPSFFYMGSPTLVAGFPRPQRFWSRFRRIVNSESAIESLLYVGLMPSLIRSLQIQLRRDVTNFQQPQHYLALSDDHTILISIIERGHNYAVVVVRGGEIQDQTSCHRQEINALREAYTRCERLGNVICSSLPLRRIDTLKGLYIDKLSFSDKQIFTRDFQRKVLNGFLILLYDRSERLMTEYKDYAIWEFKKSKLKRLKFFKTYFPGDESLGDYGPPPKVEQKFKDGKLPPPQIFKTSRAISHLGKLEEYEKKFMPQIECASLREIAISQGTSFEDNSSSENEEEGKVEEGSDEEDQELAGDKRTQFILTLLFNCFPTLLNPSHETIHQDLWDFFSHRKYHPFLSNSPQFRAEIELMLSQALIASFYRDYIDMNPEDPTTADELLKSLEGIEVLGFKQFDQAAFKVLDLGSKVFTTVDFYGYQIKQLREKDFNLEMLKLREEVVRNIWGNIAFELMYVGIDDEERRTLQENPKFIQNILSSLAESPLGYGVFSSGPILIHF